MKSFPYLPLLLLLSVIVYSCIKMTGMPVKHPYAPVAMQQK